MTTDASHATVDRSVDVAEMTVGEASKELLQLLPGDTDLEEGEEEIVDAQGDDEGEGAGKAAGKEGKDAEGDAAEDKADDGETQDDETDPEGEEVEVFVVPVAGGGEEEVTLEELAAGYSRQSDYTRKTQQLADDRRAVEGELAETRTVRGEYAERVKLLNTTLDNMTPEIDWEQVKRDDTENYATRYTDHQRQEVKRQTLKTEAERVEQEDVADRAKQHAVLLAEEKTLLFKAIPDLADPEKSKALITELADYAESQFGVDRGQFDNVEAFWIGMEDYLVGVEAIDLAAFDAALRVEMGPLGVTDADAALVLARADSGFVAGGPDRAAVHDRVETLIAAALDLHAFLVANESNIEHVPASSSVTDPVLEASANTPEIRTAMEDRIDSVTGALADLGYFDAVTFDDFWTAVLAQVQEVSVR